MRLREETKLLEHLGRQEVFLKILEDPCLALPCLALPCLALPVSNETKHLAHVRGEREAASASANICH